MEVVMGSERKTLRIKTREASLSSIKPIIDSKYDEKRIQTKTVNFKLSLGHDKPSQKKKVDSHKVGFSFSGLRLGSDDNPQKKQSVEETGRKFDGLREKKSPIDLTNKQICIRCGHIGETRVFKSNEFVLKNRYQKQDDPDQCPICGSEDIESALKVEFCVECGIRPVYDGYNDEIEDTDLCGWCLMEKKKRTGEFQPYEKTG